MSEQRARRWAILSGKGGVGKTMIAANLAAALAAAGQRTLVLDADLGLANMDVILGLNPARTLHDFFQGSCGIEDVLLRAPGGFDLLPAGSGMMEATHLTPRLSEHVEALLADLDQRYDRILFDGGAGIGDVVLFFGRLADEILVVVTPEQTSVVDAYATIKVIARKFDRDRFSIVVNQTDPTRPDQAGNAVAAHLQKVVSQFLEPGDREPVRISLLGAIPTDPAVGLSIRRQQLLSSVGPQSPAAGVIARIAQGMITAGEPKRAQT